MSYNVCGFSKQQNLQYTICRRNICFTLCRILNLYPRLCRKQNFHTRICKGLYICKTCVIDFDHLDNRLSRKHCKSLKFAVLLTAYSVLTAMALKYGNSAAHRAALLRKPWPHRRSHLIFTQHQSYSHKTLMLIKLFHSLFQEGYLLSTSFIQRFRSTAPTPLNSSTSSVQECKITC